MAVIVQSLIAADTSGVIFTVDPITGSRSSMVIEACFGLGDALVSGKVAPDRFVVGKKNLKLLSEKISNKKIMSVPDKNGTVIEQTLSDEKSLSRTLDNKQIKRLAKLSEKIEAGLSGPQDIEWAVRGAELFFLQSRPITTIPKEKLWPDRQVWSNAVAQEVLPDVVTPATLSIIQSFAEAIFDPVLRALCMDRGNHPHYDVLAGRVYFNANIWLAAIRALPVINKYDFSDDIGSEPGLREIVEIELFNARWAETPDYILSMLGSYVRSIGKTDPLENHRKLHEQREQLTRKCRRSLRNPFKRILFNYLLVRAQRGSVFRENVKCEIVRLLTAVRIMLLELASRLHAESLIRDPKDIFFLRLEEIEPVTQGRAGFDVTAIIAGRRSEYDHWQTITPPGTIVGRFDPQKTVPAPLEADAEVLKGLTVSAGVVTGNARVILRADEQQQLLPGEILVAPFTDPGWTPYFVPAAAVVMDLGSLLSHGSIVAREYGIPAVVNVGAATKIIKTGQTIQVDGNRGVVRILQ